MLVGYAVGASPARAEERWQVGEPEWCLHEAALQSIFWTGGGGCHCLEVWDTWGKSILGFHKSYGMLRGGNKGRDQGVLVGNKGGKIR